MLIIIMVILLMIIIRSLQIAHFTPRKVRIRAMLFMLKFASYLITTKTYFLPNPTFHFFANTGNSHLTWSSVEYVERISVRQVPGRGHLAHISQASQVNEAIGEFLREMPWRPLSPLEEKSSSSLVRRVMGASLAAVTSTVNK